MKNTLTLVAVILFFLFLGWVYWLYLEGQKQVLAFEQQKEQNRHTEEMAMIKQKRLGSFSEIAGNVLITLSKFIPMIG